MMHTNVNVLVTGAGGFVGQVLTKLLLEQGYFVRAIVRNRKMTVEHPNLEQVYCSDLNEFSPSIFENIDVVIHLAAQVHQLNPNEKEKKLYYDVNLDLTSKLATAALDSTIQQFIYLSTIKVNGEKTDKNRPFCVEDAPNPQDEYAKSKYLAELNLQRIFAHSEIAHTIIRPPLVYGPGAAGNFEQLVHLVQKKSFLLKLLGGVQNKRSLIQVNYLAKCLKKAILNPAVYNQLLLIADSKDISTPELISYIAYLNQTKIKLWKISPSILSLMAKFIGAKEKFQKITGNLQIDSRKSRELLGEV